MRFLEFIRSTASFDRPSGKWDKSFVALLLVWGLSLLFLFAIYPGGSSYSYNDTFIAGFLCLAICYLILLVIHIFLDRGRLKESFKALAGIGLLFILTSGLFVGKIVVICGRTPCGMEGSELANIAIAQEAYFVEHLVYALTQEQLAVMGYKGHPMIEAEITTGFSPSSAPYFTATAHHEECKYPISRWDSSKGGLQKRK